jgi:hypothetical protein
MVLVERDLDMYLTDTTFNADCRFDKVGDAIADGAAGWAFSLLGGNSSCPQLLVGAFSEMLQTLSDEGLVAQLYRKYLKLEATRG